jgi:hypothetical protein
MFVNILVVLFTIPRDYAVDVFEKTRSLHAVWHLGVVF